MSYYHIIVPALWATVQLGGYEDTALHGHNYTFYCTVTVIAGLALPVTMEWLHSNGSAVSNDRFMVHSANVSRVTTLTMTVAPILTTDGGKYSCQASVNVPWMDEQPPNIAESVHIPVTSKSISQIRYVAIVSIFYLFFLSHSSSPIPVNDGPSSILCKLESKSHIIINYSKSFPNYFIVVFMQAS